MMGRLVFCVLWRTGKGHPPMSSCGERLKGRVCVVTGAASSLAETIAEQLTSEGATVVGVDLRDHRVGAQARQADLTNEDQVSDLFATIKNDFGPAVDSVTVPAATPASLMRWWGKRCT